jgi:PEGA domain
MQPSRQPCLLALLLLASLLPAAGTRADSLTITTSPAGATIEINGLAAGTTPYKIDYPGSYFHKPHTAFSARLEHALTIRISKDGYLAQQVTLTNGPFDWVAVTGRRRGSYFLLKAGDFEIKLEAISYGNAGQPAEIAGREGPLRPPSAETLRSQEAKNSSEGGSVAIASEPADADIYIDGKFVGQTPSTVRLPAGAHHVEVRAQGKQNWERDLEVLKDSQLTLHAVFGP